MSGISGIYFRDGRPVDAAIVDAMGSILSHRGPDRAGRWIEGPIGFGHRLLYTTPESLHEQLPLVSRNGHFVLTADARIDNRDELLGALGFAGLPPGEITDSEIILKAYEEWGENCPERLLGDFAFAIWDSRRKLLFCARDHVGIKQFYYYQSGSAFVFGSEIKAIYCLPEVPCEINRQTIADFVMLTSSDPARTLYSGISRLPAGHTLSVEPERSRLRKYWHLDASRELKLGSDAEYADAFREIFTEAVRCRLRSAYPVGSELSGGLDSSAIVCQARNILSAAGRPPLHTISAVFRDVPASDESPFIDSVLSSGGVIPHSVRPDLQNPLGDMERQFWYQDGPFLGPNLYILWSGENIATASAGIRVLLSGDGGDEVASRGYESLGELARRVRWIRLMREVSALSEHFPASTWSLLKTHGIRPQVPKPLLEIRRWLKAAASGDDGQRRMLSPELASEFGLDSDAGMFSGQPWWAPVGRVAHRETITDGYLNCFDVSDKASAPFMIERRYPLWDRRLIEFCLALPLSQKLWMGWNRIVFRRAMEGVLPLNIQWRGGKGNLSHNFQYALPKFGRDILNDLTANPPATLQDYVDVSEFRTRCSRLLSVPRPSDALSVWVVATLALWLRERPIHRLRERPPQPPPFVAFTLSDKTA